MNAEQICTIFQNTPDSALDQVMEALKGIIHNKDSAGYTPLNWACRKRFNSLALKLIEKNADVNTVADDENTPLIWACYHKTEDVALALIEKNANVDAADNGKNTPLIWACFNAMETLALALIKKNADINAQDNTKNTPFSIACSSSLEKVAFKLLEKNADITVRNNDGRTGTDYIKQNWNADAKKRILDLIESKNKPVGVPVVQPETPIEQPATPVVTPKTPVITPVIAPVQQSETPVQQSETPSVPLAKPYKDPTKSSGYPLNTTLLDYLHQNRMNYRVKNGMIKFI